MALVRQQRMGLLSSKDWLKHKIIICMVSFSVECSMCRSILISIPLIVCPCEKI